MPTKRSPSPTKNNKPLAAAEAAIPPSVRRRREHERLIVLLFKGIDADGDGFLEKRELQRGLRNAACLKLINQAPALQSLLDPEHWEKTFSLMDDGEDKDGRVTFTEFHRYCMEIVGSTDDGISHIDSADIPTNEQAIALLQVSAKDRKEEHIDALLLWSKTNEATKKLFDPLPVDLLREVVRELKYTKIMPGDFVCEQGDIGSLFYVILKGTIDFFVRGEIEQLSEMNLRRSNGLHTEKPTSVTLIRENRIGKLVATMTTGAGFGELALLAPAGAAKRSASCLCPATYVSIHQKPTPCHLLTLERSVYYRLFRATQSIGTDIGAKVRTIQDSFAFSHWPRSDVVRFCIQLQIVKIPKDSYLIRSGRKADRFFLISSGQVSETQPMTLKNRINQKNQQKTQTIVYPWHTNRNKTEDESIYNKINIDLGTYGPLDVVGGLPTLMDYPYYFTTLKAKTNVVAVSIGRTYFNMFLRPPPPVIVSLDAVPSSSNKNDSDEGSNSDSDNDSVFSINSAGNTAQTSTKKTTATATATTTKTTMAAIKHDDDEDHGVPVYYTKAIDVLTKSARLREAMRKQRVRTALSSPNISCKMTTAMTRHFTTCGRCGRRGHGWGEENDYGMLKCPLGQGVGHNKSKTRHSVGFFGSKLSKKELVKLKHEKRAMVNKTTRRTTPRLMGSNRWSSRQSLRMRGGGTCTVNSLASLLGMYEKEDREDSGRPATSMGHTVPVATPNRRDGGRVRRRPNTSMGIMKRKVHVQVKATAPLGETQMLRRTVPATSPARPPLSSKPNPVVLGAESPNLRNRMRGLRGRSMKVMHLMHEFEHGNLEEFVDNLHSKEKKYVMAKQIDQAEEGRRFEQDRRAGGHHYLLS